MDRVIANVWVGNGGDAANHPLLVSKGITHILCVAKDWVPYTQSAPASLHYAKYGLIDGGGNPDGAFDEAVNLFLSMKAEADACGGHILSHCAAGISRSASVAAAGMAHLEGWTFEKMLMYMKCSRPMISPTMELLALGRAYKKT